MLIDAKNFEMIEVPLDDLYLDPNNPRFSDEKDILIDEADITNDAVQVQATERIAKVGIKDLVDSIQNIGFLKIDRVVVREIDSAPKKFVVVEGNRRIAACKKINEAYTNCEVPKKVEEVIDTIKNLEVLQYKGQEKDISWVIQGIRHISGAKTWKPFQQAQLLVKLEKEQGVSPSEASETLGIGPIIASRLVRAYYGYRQAQDDEDYGSLLKPSHFTYFNDVVFFRTVLREWLEWSDDDRKFNNSENLKKMLSWFIPPEDFEEDCKSELKITQARELRDIVIKAMIEQTDLFKKFVSDDKMTADQLQYELGKKSATDESEWYDIMTDFSNSIDNLPTIKILNRKDEFLDVFSKIIEKLQKHKQLLEKM